MALRKNVSRMLQTKTAKRILHELCEQAYHALDAHEIDFTAFKDDQAQHDPGEVILDDTIPNDDEGFADQAVTHHQVADTPIKEEDVLWDTVHSLDPMRF